MIGSLRRHHPASSTAAPRIGFCGLLGTGNLGNDGSLEAVLDVVRTELPDAVLGCLCSGPEEIHRRYGLPCVRLNWYRLEYQTASGPLGIAAKLLGKVVDAFRTAAWVRRFDVVVVPGMGILESALPMRAWGWPYSLFLVCLAGRLCGTRVALVSVGAEVVEQSATRRLITGAARLAHHRSYRDELSRDSMLAMGVDTSSDAVLPDLAFALPVPTDITPVPGLVGVGLMDYRGGQRDRARAADIHAGYLAKMIEFVRWLIDEDHDVRLFIGDSADAAAVAAVLRALPDDDRHRVQAAPATSLTELMERMAQVEVVVATRYHNIVCAVKLAKPTVSIAYAAKNDELMASIGLGGACQAIATLDVGVLTTQFADVRERADDIGRVVADRDRQNRVRLRSALCALRSSILTEHPDSRRFIRQ